MQRPTSVTVFGILNLVFAAFGFVGLLISLVLFFVPESSENHVVKLIHSSPAYAAYLKISIGLGLLACLALLAAGIGLLMLKPWARTLSIVYAIYSILQAIVGTIINYFLLVRPLIEQAQNSSGPEAAAAMGGAIGGTIGGCVGLIYPALLLFFMMRPNVVAAFRPPVYPPVT
jgi:hypothetical protein